MSMRIASKVISPILSCCLHLSMTEGYFGGIAVDIVPPHQ